MYASLFDLLSQSVTLKSEKTASDAIQALNEGNLKAVIITDEGLTARANKKVLNKVKTFVQNGGLAIVGLHFNPSPLGTHSTGSLLLLSSPGSGETIDVIPLTSIASVPCPPTAVAASFPEWVNMKAVHVAHVRPDERIFLSGSSYPEALEAGVAATQVGSGYLAYVGDANAEVESNKVILALCGF
ncbi:hypothetical protein BJX65DRAFT_301272 [Aspergillus insuetus]